ncbi:hypothetical protein BDEG_27930 [Batrachochytrium dendrobatidis JEL423]|uniref:Transcription initiation factor TFIID subunit 12 domain-containing protein n=1 Tax=Batrachochytrium dendrobatidis (strain JEL423) TaxID=403673 RepID=A0A177WXA9_BATDL|nr:hypothetical protein BDEG_27930 [Batrachochytrium dendrobatidis JEL423]
MKDRPTRRSILVASEKNAGQSTSDTSNQHGSTDLTQDAQRLVAASSAGSKMHATSQSSFSNFNVPMANFHQQVLLQYAAMHAAASSSANSSVTAAAVAAVAGSLNSAGGRLPAFCLVFWDLIKLVDSSLIDMSSQPLFSKDALRALMRQVDAEQKLDVDVEDLLLDVASDFVLKVAHSSCLLAKHRHSTTLELKDAQLHLDRNYDIRVPGFGEELPEITRRRKTGQRVHASRILHIRETIRKSSMIKRSERLRAKKRN